MLAFIDESGDTGLRMAAGASAYFVITMVIFEDHDEALACEQRLMLLRRELHKEETFEFHFHKNSNHVREAFFRAVLPYAFFYYGIVINKEKLFGEGFRNKESFYKYASGLLFENAKQRLEKAIVVIDKSGRELFKYQLATYLKKNINSHDHQHVKKVKMQDSHKNNLLQLADMISGALFRSLQKRKEDSQYRDMVRAREIYVQIWPK